MSSMHFPDLSARHASKRLRPVPSLPPSPCSPWFHFSLPASIATVRPLLLRATALFSEPSRSVFSFFLLVMGRVYALTMVVNLVNCATHSAPSSSLHTPKRESSMAFQCVSVAFQPAVVYGASTGAQPESQSSLEAGIKLEAPSAPEACHVSPFRSDSVTPPQGGR